MARPAGPLRACATSTRRRTPAAVVSRRARRRSSPDDAEGALAGELAAEAIAAPAMFTALGRARQWLDAGDEPASASSSPPPGPAAIADLEVLARLVSTAAGPPSRCVRAPTIFGALGVARGCRSRRNPLQDVVDQRRSLNNRRPSAISREVLVKDRPSRLSGLEHPGRQCVYALRGERPVGIIPLGLDPLLARIDSGGPRKRTQGLPGPTILVSPLEKELRVAFAKGPDRFIF